MKKLFLLFVGGVLLVSCSSPTNEEKARKLVEPEIKSTLYEPSSYKFENIQLDSCFADAMNSAEAIDMSVKIAKLYKEYKEIKDEAERAESSMTIYVPSYGYQSAHSKQQYEKYKKEFELAQRKLESRKNQIISTYKDNIALLKKIANKEHEFTGWCATVTFSAKNMLGFNVSKNDVFFLDKDVTQIIKAFDENELNELTEIDEEEFKFEFEDALNEALGKEVEK